MSARNVTVSDRLVEPTFVVGLVLGAGMLGIGFGILVLGLSVGVETGAAVSGSIRTLTVGVGLAVLVAGLLVRWSRHDADRRYLEPAAVVVAAAMVVGGVAVALVGLEGLAVLPVDLPVVDAGTWLPAADFWSAGAVGLGLVLLAAAVPVGRRRTGATRNELEFVLWGAGSAVAMLGLTGLFIGLSSHTAVSSPFLATARDKVLLILLGQLLIFSGWTTIRLAGRTIGW